MIVIIKGIQRQYKTTAAVAYALELTRKGGYSPSEIVSNIHLFRPGDVGDIQDFKLQGLNPSISEHLEKISEIYDFCKRNQVMELPGYHYLNNNNIRKFMEQVVSRGFKHKIILIDEIDRVFSHRFWQKAEQTESLLGLWQDEKLFNWIIGTAHIGKSVDTMIRESMQIEIITKTLIKHVSAQIFIINKLKMKVYQKVMVNIPFIQRLFYSWEPVH